MQPEKEDPKAAKLQREVDILRRENAEMHTKVITSENRVKNAEDARNKLHYKLEAAKALLRRSVDVAVATDDRLIEDTKAFLDG